MKCGILLQKRILSNLIQESNIFGIFFIVINEVYKWNIIHIFVNLKGKMKIRFIR